MANRVDPSLCNVRLAYARAMASTIDDSHVFGVAKRMFSQENYVNWDGSGCYPVAMQDKRISWGIFPDDSLFLALSIVLSHNSLQGMPTLKLLVLRKNSKEIEESPNIYMFDPGYRAANLSSLLDGQTLSFGRGWTARLKNSM